MLHRIELALGQQIFEADRTSVWWSPAVDLKVDSHLSKTPATEALSRKPAYFIG
jgi:hypothetical protein